MKNIILKSKKYLNKKNFNKILKTIKLVLSSILLPIAFLLLIAGLVIIQGIESLTIEENNKDVIDI